MDRQPEIHYFADRAIGHGNILLFAFPTKRKDRLFKQHRNHLEPADGSLHPDVAGVEKSLRPQPGDIILHPNGLFDVCLFAG